jgi:hypothetical protein
MRVPYWGKMAKSIQIEFERLSEMIKQAYHKVLKAGCTPNSGCSAFE